MNSSEAKRILSLYRPGIDEKERDVQEALELAKTDAELAAWLKGHKQFQRAVQHKFNEIVVPKNLLNDILATQKVARPDWSSRRPLLLAIAALVVIFVGVAILFRPKANDRFSDYENRMVRGALREYRMDLVTNDLAQVRLWMASRGAPSEFPLPKGLSKLQVVGGGTLKWRNNPVSMVCFDRGDKQMLFFFVLNKSAVKDSPSPTPELAHISRLQSASWTHGDKVYVLAGPEEAGFVQKYL